MSLHPVAIAWCRFYIRAAAGDDQFRYESIHCSCSRFDGRIPTPHPPLPGDLISLWDSLEKKGGMFRVIERSWHHASYGSVNWPYTENLPVEGPGMDIIVEPAEGVFRNEVPVP